MKEYANAAINYGIGEGKVLEYTRELIGHEANDRWADQPIGGADRPHTSSSCAGFSRGGFLSLSNPEKYIFVLQNVKRMAEV